MTATILAFPTALDFEDPLEIGTGGTAVVKIDKERKRAAAARLVKKQFGFCKKLLTRRAFFWNSLRILLGASTLFGAVYAFDRTVGAKLLAPHVVSYALPAKISDPCENAQAKCQANANEMLAAYKIGKAGMEKLGMPLPSYIDEEHLARVFYIESGFCVLPDDKGSSYEGCAQYSRSKQDDSFYQNMPSKLALLNLVKDQVPVLAGFKQITVETIKREDVFRDMRVSTLLKMVDSYFDDKAQSVTNPLYKTLDGVFKAITLYMRHNLPTVARNLAHDNGCSHGVATMHGEKFLKFFKANSGLYHKSGSANPMEVAGRFVAITNGALDYIPEPTSVKIWKWFGYEDPRLVALDTNNRPGQKGFISIITAQYNDALVCPTVPGDPAAARIARIAQNGTTAKALKPVKDTPLPQPRPEMSHGQKLLFLSVQ